MSRSGNGHIYTRIFRSYLLVALIPVLCLAVLIVYFTREYSMSKVEDELVLLTQGAAGVIQRELEKDEESLRILASDESLARFLLEKEPDQDDVISLNQKLFLITGGKQQSVYLHLVTPDGSILHSTTGQTGIPDKVRSYWGVLRALEGARDTVCYSGIYGSDEYGMTIALPVSCEGEEEHYADDINVRSIAAALSISESHLSKVFKDTVHSTIGEYLTNYRINRACMMLKDPQIRIYEVAVRCGYNDQRYFSVIFKRIMGMTPNEFRSRSTKK